MGRRYPLYVVSMIVLASDVKLEASMRIESRGDLAKVAFAAKVSVFAAMPCAVDGRSPTVASEAVNAPSHGGPKAADKHSTRRARPGRKALDVTKNLLR